MPVSCLDGRDPGAYVEIGFALRRLSQQSRRERVTFDEVSNQTCARLDACGVAREQPSETFPKFDLQVLLPIHPMSS
jgi:hypothetical protein